MIIGKKQIDDLRITQQPKDRDFISIAIDGPAGAGKSSVAKVLAKKYGFLYFNTGELYRSIAYACLYHDVQVDDKEMVEIMARYFPLDYRVTEDTEGKHLEVYLKDRDITSELHSEFISNIVPTVAQYPAVRRHIRQIQRDIASQNDIVMEGRDIGTVVLPDATYKFFITASPETRALRRFAEQKTNGENCTYGDILESIILRDEQDSKREESPLKKADDAITIDTSNMGLYDSVRCIQQKISQSTQSNKESALEKQN